MLIHELSNDMGDLTGYYAEGHQDLAAFAAAVAEADPECNVELDELPELCLHVRWRTEPWPTEEDSDWKCFVLDIDGDPYTVWYI